MLSDNRCSKRFMKRNTVWWIWVNFVVDIGDHVISTNDTKMNGHHPTSLPATTFLLYSFIKNKLKALQNTYFYANYNYY